MNVLILNAGSSSLRFQLVATDREAMRKDQDRRLLRGHVERIGGPSLIRWQLEGQDVREVEEAPLRDHRAAIEHLLRLLVRSAHLGEVRSLADVHAVGHRVVHGGQMFRSSVAIDDRVLAAIEDHAELAPLHNPANVRGIQAARELLGPGVPQVAVFDTAFHATLSEAAFLYALPYHYYRRFKLRRYGFHGTSHRYVAYRYRKLLGIPREEVRIVTLHLGNGCSACAIRAGDSVDTSMGFTPLEGLVMGTRCGDVDPSVIDFLVQKEGLSVSEVEAVLNKHSGLLGISGMTGDMRELLEEEAESDDRRVGLAIDIFCRRVRKYIGAYHAELGGADAVVFAGGIGENAPSVRARVCEGLAALGLELDPAANESAVGGVSARISTAESRLAAYVIPTDEELLIARDTVRVVEGELPVPM